jgi:5-methylcytosine-specific restriction endonuclease McrA
MLPIDILDNQEIAMLPADKWCELIRGYISNPDNQRRELNSPERAEWLSIQKRMKRLVFARDGRVCRKCGATNRLEIDHIIPIARGGTNEPDNLQVLCRHCNAKKWAKI